jgi:hypothetical protein
LESNLQTVTDDGNVTTHGIRVFGSVDVDGFFFGDAGFVTDVPSNPGVPELQTVTGYGPSTSDKVSFSDVYADGNVIVNGTVTCSELIGDGEFLGGVANVYELSVLDPKITVTESNIIITNTSGLTDVTKGDLLVSTSDGVLDRLTIGSTDQVLLANVTSNQLEWVDVDFPDITGDIPDRLASMEQNVMFTNTNTISSLATGDVLYAEDTNKLVNLERETRADNTFLTTGDYGTGFGRLLRMDEHGENIMWLHPTSNLETYYTQQGTDVLPLFDDNGGYGTFLRIKNRLYDDVTFLRYRIDVSSNFFDIKFGQGMFYHQAGIEYSATIPYVTDPSGNPYQPEDIKYHWYVQGNLKIAGDYHGDGSFLVITNLLQHPTPSTLSPGTSGVQLGKDGYLLTYSDRRRKTKINSISNALDKLAKLIPKLYDKDGKRSCGLIAQEVYYKAKELRHIVWPDRDANPNDDAPEPDYSDWGIRPACIRYPQLVAYMVKSIQELRERIELLKNNKK